MKISYDWLREYVETDVSADRLAEMLTMAGLSVESIIRLGADHILETEITANRPDWLSVIGVAREISAMTGKKLNMPKIKTPNTAPAQNDINIKVEDAPLCPKYTARVIRGVRVAESPAWLKARIEAMGLRSVNNIVDITNFCLFETGEPMHAFDLDKISGRQILIRKARQAEKLVTIDGKEAVLDPSVLIIADSARPIAVAGVMGGLNTEVTAATQNILLEAAYFDPVSIRRTSRKLGVSTDSSYRFERRVDIENIVYASERAAGLICEIAGGAAEDIISIGQAQDKKRTVSMSGSKLNKLSGMTIPPEKAKAILAGLGLRSISQTTREETFEIPGFRQDLQSEIDLIEEVLRVYGYNNVPDTMPNVMAQTNFDPKLKFEKTARQILCGFGLDEIIGYSLLNKKLAGCAASLPADSIAEIMNPLSAEQEMMRPSLMSGMLGAIAWNLNRKNKDLKLFELGNVYYKKSGDSFGQDKYICVGICGQINGGWDGCARHVQFSDIRGIFENLCEEFGMQEVSFEESQDTRFSSLARAILKIKGRPVGVCGAVSQRLLSEFDIKDKVYLLEVNLEELFGLFLPERRFKELPKYPSILRDISIVVSKETRNAPLVSVIRTAGGFILKSVDLVDRYSGKQIPEEKISLTYRLEYQDPHKTLEDKDVAGVHSNILAALEKNFGAKLR